MIHAKQLCLLCLQHPLSVGCEIVGKGLGCPMEDCDRPHHAALHGVLKAGGPSPPGGKAGPPGGPAVSMDCGTPEVARKLRGLLEGLGIDPNDLEVRIGVRQPGEPGQPRGGGITDPAETETDTARGDRSTLGGSDLTLPSRGEVRGLCSRERPTDGENEGSRRDSSAEIEDDSERVDNGWRGPHTREEQRVDAAPGTRRARERG
jgi:hypothetical protein